MDPPLTFSGSLRPAVDWRVSQSTHGHLAPPETARRSSAAAHDRARPRGGLPRRRPRRPCWRAVTRRLRARSLAGHARASLAAERRGDLRPRGAGATRPIVVEAIVEDTPPRPRCSRELGEILGEGHAARHHHLGAVGRRRWAPRAGAPSRFAALHVFNPVTEDGARRARLPGRGDAETPRARSRSVRRARQDAGRGPRHARLRRQPAALPLPVRRRAPARAHRHGAEGDRHLHEARRRPPDRAAGAARPRRASTSSSAIGETIGATVPAPRRGAGRRGRAGPQERPRVPHLRRSCSESFSTD